MIEQLAAERLYDAGEAPGRPQIRLARSRNPARMVVREKDGGAVVPSGVHDNLAKREIETAHIAKVAR